MAKNKEIAFETKQGYKYLIEFREEPNNQKLNIISISINLLDDKNIGLGLSDILKIAKIFKIYLISNKNVVLAYACDNRACYVNKKNKHLSFLEYRKNLFDGIFDRLNDGTFYKNDAEIRTENEIECFSFIGFKEDSELIDRCSQFVTDKYEGS